METAHCLLGSDFYGQDPVTSGGSSEDRHGFVRSLGLATDCRLLERVNFVKARRRFCQPSFFIDLSFCFAIPAIPSSQVGHAPS